MKRLVETWIRRHRRARALVFRVDRPRGIDRVIDYFGEQVAPVLVSSARWPSGRDTRRSRAVARIVTCLEKLDLE